jgi:hypothetical protein
VNRALPFRGAVFITATDRALINGDRGVMQMRSKHLTLQAASSLALALAATLTCADGGSPPPTTVECSPGYWKNHQEVWIPAACGTLNCDTILGLLYWTGETPGIYKNLGAGILNDWAGRNNIAVNCED